MKPSAQLGNFIQGFPNQHQPSIGSNSLGIRPQYSQNSSNKDTGPNGPSIHVTKRTQSLAGEAARGLNPKQLQLYQNCKCFDFLTTFCLVFTQFSGDGAKISAIEFFKLCKLLKIYPVVISFEDLKKIVLKNKEFWSIHRPGGPQDDIPEPSQDNSFPFNEFVNAFRVSSNYLFSFASRSWAA